MYPVGDYLEIFKIDKTFRFYSPDSLDKEKSDPNMPSMAVPVADVGSGNYIVARVFIQTMEGITHTPLRKGINTKELALLAHKAKELLLGCEGSYNNFLAQYDSAVKDIGAGIKKSGNVFMGVPTVKGLPDISSAFLMAAKNVIQVEAEIFNEFFQTKFDGPRFDKVLQWAEANLSKNPAFIQFLSDNHAFLKCIVDMRNAQEHPKKEKELIVKDFRLQPHHKIAPPTWHVTGSDEMDMKSDMKDILDGLVVFHESLMVYCLMTNLNSKFPYKVLTIPEEDRDLNCPIRYKLEIDLNIV